MSGVDGASRHRAREAALQMLYQTEVGRASAHEAVRTYYEDYVKNGAAVLMAPMDRIIVSDNSVANESVMTTLGSWRIAKQTFFAIMKIEWTT